MNRRDAFFEQLVSSQNANEWLNDPEVADRAMMADLGFAGIMSGLVASQHGSGDLTVDVTGGVAYDQLGERCYVPSTQNVDLSVDYLGVSTAVVSSGDSKVISLFIKFDRTLQTPVTDGNGNTVYYDELEAYQWYVKQGSEAATGTQVPPAKESDGLLVCNVTLAYTSGTQAILTGNITTTARDSLVVIQPSGTPYLTIREGSYLAALTDIVTAVNAVVAGSAGLNATGIAYGGSGNWAGGITGVPAGSVAAALTYIVAKLADEGVSTSGANRIGCGQITGNTVVINAGTLTSVLTALQSAASIDMVASQSLQDATTIVANNIQAWLQALVSRLSAQSPVAGTADGAGLIGAKASGSLAAGNVRSQLDALNAGKVAVLTSGQSYPLPAGTSITRVQESVFLDTMTGAVGIGQIPAPPGDQIKVSINAPNGATLNSIAIHLAAGGGVSPTSEASFALYKQDTTAGTTTEIGTAATDPGTNTSGHDLTMTGLTEVVDRTKYHYFVIFTPESGGTPGTRTIYSPRVTSTVPYVDSGCV